MLLRRQSFLLKPQKQRKTHRSIYYSKKRTEPAVNGSFP